MVFGEIIEPSTRALLDDEEYVATKDLEWITNFQIPERINTLLVVESNFAIELVTNCMLSSEKVACKTQRNELMVYKCDNDNVVVLCNALYDASVGELTSLLLPLVKNTKNLYALTTQPAIMHQSALSNDEPSYLRVLSTEVTPELTLERPNLVTGVGANLLSYAIHTGRNCSLYVGYVDHAPVDSLNSQPFIKLLQKLKLNPKITMREQKIPSNNLYM